MPARSGPSVDYASEANWHAARATEHWLVGRGLAAEAQDLIMAPMEGNRLFALRRGVVFSR